MPKVFERAMARRDVIADYLKGITPVDFDDLCPIDQEGLFQGTGASRGEVTGSACVVTDLREIGKLNRGDNATDAGWTPPPAR